MEIEWDGEKDAQNRAKHGVGLGEAARLEWGKAKYEVDERFDYREDRAVAYAYLGPRLYACVFTNRGPILRIISLRKANKREIRRYGI